MKWLIVGTVIILFLTALPETWCKTVFLSEPVDTEWSFCWSSPSQLTHLCLSSCVWPLQRNLTEYFVAVDVNNMLHLYASMLYERRILICCSKLSTVSRVHFLLLLSSTALSMSVSCIISWSALKNCIYTLWPSLEEFRKYLSCLDLKGGVNPICRIWFMCKMFRHIPKINDW